MRGVDYYNEQLFSFVRTDSRVPKDHPLRVIRSLVNTALEGMSDLFQFLYARDGRPSDPT